MESRMNQILPGVYASPELGELFKALSKTQGEMEFASKDGKNPFYKSKYSTLTAVIKASRPFLSKNGLSVSQIECMPPDGGPWSLSTILNHDSGQFIGGSSPINPSKKDIQSAGSYISYLKRYAYSSIVGVATEDDDGEKATRPRIKEITQEERLFGPPISKQITLKEIDLVTKDHLYQLKDELEGELELAEEILNKMNLKELKEMPRHKFLPTLKRIREIKLARTR